MGQTVPQPEQWVAAYYPIEIMWEPRSRAIMCLLFDKVVCHFPMSGMSCGGGNLLYDQVVYDLHPKLVGCDVLEAREVTFLPGVGDNLSWWDSDEELEQFCRLQVTAMALEACATGNAVPISDDAHWSVPVYLLQNIDLLRSARLQAFALALESLEIALPPIANISDEDILQAREDLKEQLIPFRRAMLALSPALRSAMESEASPLVLHREAKYIVETQVAPALGDLSDKLRKEKGRFWRRLVLKGGAILPQLILNWTTKSALAAAVEAISSGKDLALDFIDRDKLVTCLKAKGGLGFLLAVREHPRLRPARGQPKQPGNRKPGKSGELSYPS